jgi:hypothetical protein
MAEMHDIPLHSSSNTSLSLLITKVTEFNILPTVKTLKFRYKSISFDFVPFSPLLPVGEPYWWLVFGSNVLFLDSAFFGRRKERFVWSLSPGCWRLRWANFRERVVCFGLVGRTACQTGRWVDNLHNVSDKHTIFDKDSFAAGMNCRSITKVIQPSS